jgi:hypothetical protein
MTTRVRWAKRLCLCCSGDDTDRDIDIDEVVSKRRHHGTHDRTPSAINGNILSSSPSRSKAAYDELRRQRKRKAHTINDSNNGDGGDTHMHMTRTRRDRGDDRNDAYDGDGKQEKKLRWDNVTSPLPSRDRLSRRRSRSVSIAPSSPPSPPGSSQEDMPQIYDRRPPSSSTRGAAGDDRAKSVPRARPSRVIMDDYYEYDTSTSSKKPKQPSSAATQVPAAVPPPTIQRMRSLSLIHDHDTPVDVDTKDSSGTVAQEPMFLRSGTALYRIPAREPGEFIDRRQTRERKAVCEFIRYLTLTRLNPGDLPLQQNARAMICCVNALVNKFPMARFTKAESKNGTHIDIYTAY